MTQTLTEGTTFTLTTDLSGPYIGYPGYGSNIRVIASGKNVTVQKIGKSSVWLRGVTNGKGNVRSRTKSIVVPKDELPNYIDVDTPAVPKRKLGETPEGDHIAINDPRIAWIWKDTGAAANKYGLCSTYDSFADKLGIPGREREFTVTRNIGGFSVRRKFLAQSQSDAETKFDAELVESGLKV